MTMSPLMMVKEDILADSPLSNYPLVSHTRPDDVCRPHPPTVLDTVSMCPRSDIHMVTRKQPWKRGVSNVARDGKNTLEIKALGVAISTYETRPPRHPLRGRLDTPPPQRREDVRQFAHEQRVAGHHGRATEDLEATGNSPSAPGAVHQRSQFAGLALAM